MAYQYVTRGTTGLSDYALQEMRAWLTDCGFNGEWYSERALVVIITKLYDGGLPEFMRHIYVDTHQYV